MIRAFLTVLNMSITASIAVAAVLVLRLCLKRMPGIFSYALWLVILVRLLCPFTLRTAWGIIPYVDLTGETITQLEMTGGWTDSRKTADNVGERYGSSGKEADSSAMEPDGRTGAAAKEPEEKETPVKGLALLWAAGCAVMLLCGAISYKILALRLREIRKDGEDVVVSEKIGTPFVSGFFRPVVFIPAGLDREQEMLVRAHEEMHIARKDPVVKAIAYAALCIHWFNPLIWLSFRLMEQDMELSCDEAVLKKIGYENRKSYAKALLSLSCKDGYSHKRMTETLPGCPVAFGEKGVKARIKNALGYRGVKGWLALAATAGILAAAALLLVSSTGEAEDAATKAVAVEGNESSVETHYYIEDTAMDDQAKTEINEKQHSPEEKLTPSESTVGEDAAPGENAQAVAGSQEAEDSYAVLLRNPQGNYEDVLIEYGNPLTDFRISDAYGVRTHPVTGEKRLHSGIDMAADRGTPVLAAAEGEVFETGNDAVCGNYVILLHDNGDLTYYANCDQILVEKGQRIAPQEQIATVGNTGSSSGAHLHFALSRQGSYIAPEPVG